MKTRLIIDDNTIYEIDEDCMCENERNNNLIDKNSSPIEAHESFIPKSDSNIGVAILDTGIYPHKDFGDRIIAFKDIVNNRVKLYDDNGHGTHIAYLL